MTHATHSYSADLCPDTGKPCVEFCDPAKGDQCARTNEQISTMTEAQKAAYWFDLYLEETTQRRKLEEQLRHVGPSGGTFPWAQKAWDIMEKVDGLDSHDIILRLVELVRQRDSLKAQLEITRLGATTGGNK